MLLEKLAFKLPTMAKTVGAGSLLGAGTGALVSDDPVAGALKGGVLGAGAGFGAKKYFGNKQLFADAKSPSKLKRSKPAPKTEAKAEVKKPGSKLKRSRPVSTAEQQAFRDSAYT